MSDVRVTGLSELNQFLTQFPTKLQNNIMRGALRAGVKPILLTARQNIHSISGKLARGLQIGTRVRGTEIKAYIKATGEHKHVARWVEYGTRAHFISVSDAEKNINVRLSARRGYTVRESMTTVNRRVLRIGQTFVGPTVHHPGARPHPFARPALDQQATAAVIAAGNYVKERLATKQGIDTSHIRVEGDE